RSSTASRPVTPPSGARRRTDSPALRQFPRPVPSRGGPLFLSPSRNKTEIRKVKGKGKTLPGREKTASGSLRGVGAALEAGGGRIKTKSFHRRERRLPEMGQAAWVSRAPGGSALPPESSHGGRGLLRPSSFPSLEASL